MVEFLYVGTHASVLNDLTGPANNCAVLLEKGGLLYTILAASEDRGAFAHAAKASSALIHILLTGKEPWKCFEL
jgi:hypothetical protein